MKKPPEGGLWNLGGPGRNRTTDTRIFKYPPIDRFRFDFKGLGHQSQLVKKLCVLVPVKFENEIRVLRGVFFLCAELCIYPFPVNRRSVFECRLKRHYKLLESQRRRLNKHLAKTRVAYSISY